MQVQSKQVIEIILTEEQADQLRLVLQLSDSIAEDMYAGESYSKAQVETMISELCCMFENL